MPQFRLNDFSIKLTALILLNNKYCQILLNKKYCWILSNKKSSHFIWLNSVSVRYNEISNQLLLPCLFLHSSPTCLICSCQVDSSFYPGEVFGGTHPNIGHHTKISKLAWVIWVNTPVFPILHLFRRFWLFSITALFQGSENSIVHFPFDRRKHWTDDYDWVGKNPGKNIEAF